MLLIIPTFLAMILAHLGTQLINRKLSDELSPRMPSIEDLFQIRCSKIEIDVESKIQTVPSSECITAVRNQFSNNSFALRVNSPEINDENHYEISLTINCSRIKGCGSTFAIVGVGKGDSVTQKLQPEFENVVEDGKNVCRSTIGIKGSELKKLSSISIFLTSNISSVKLEMKDKDSSQLTIKSDIIPNEACASVNTSKIDLGGNTKVERRGSSKCDNTAMFYRNQLHILSNTRENYMNPDQIESLMTAYNDVKTSSKLLHCKTYCKNIATLFDMKGCFAAFTLQLASYIYSIEHEKPIFCGSSQRYNDQWAMLPHRDCQQIIQFINTCDIEAPFLTELWSQFQIYCDCDIRSYFDEYSMCKILDIDSDELHRHVTGYHGEKDEESLEIETRRYRQDDKGQKHPKSKKETPSLLGKYKVTIVATGAVIVSITAAVGAYILL